MTILCANGTHVYRAGQPRCTCGAAANGYPPKREEAEMYPNSWMCPNGNHTFTWTSSSTRPTHRPSGYCRCGQFYYDAQEKRVTMVFPPNVTVAPFSGYHPAGYRPPKPDPAPETSIEQLRAALRAGASHLSADGKRVYTVRYGETLEAGWNEQAREFGAWLVRPEGLPGDVVRL